MNIEIDASGALSLLEQAVKGKEDFVYGKADRNDDNEDWGCSYVKDTRPSCLVAQALSLAGVTVAQLEYLEDPEVQTANSYTVDAVELPAGLRLTTAARRVFASAQTAQDQLKPWGLALEAARMTARRVSS